MTTDNTEGKTPIRIAIADDHAPFRNALQVMLGFYTDLQVTIVAENGAVLLQKMISIIPDVCLLDLRMPVMDGYLTLMELRKLYPEVKVIVLSMAQENDAIEKAKNFGANGFLCKSSDSPVIAKTIRECFASHEFIYNTGYNV